MKFGKSLSNQIEEALPEWRDKFLSYKELKKKLKVIVPRDGERPSKRPRVEAADGEDVAGDGMTKEELEFIQLLEDELEKFNSFFVEKEEEHIIKLKELQDRVAMSMDSNEEMVKIRREIVDFHGEMVLLENYSALNYTGLVKILKKYDKRTGALIRLPYIQKVLQQPFFCTDLLYKLIKECETMLDDRLFPKIETRFSSDSSTPAAANNGDSLKVSKELAEIEHVESMYMKSSISALRALQEIRSKSSTVSVFSLPPIQVSELEETWKKIPVFEQVAD